MKKFFDKVKNTFEKKPEHPNTDRSISPTKEKAIIKEKEKKYNTDYLINLFANKEKRLDFDDIDEFDYYYNTNSITENKTDDDNPILFVGVVSFHHKKGSIVEYIHPSREDTLKSQASYFKYITAGLDKSYTSEEVLDIILNQLTFQCLPDAVHLTDEDSQFFFIQNFNSVLFGTSCYKQIKTKLTDHDVENTRDYIQKVKLLNLL